MAYFPYDVRARNISARHLFLAFWQTTPGKKRVSEVATITLAALYDVFYIQYLDG